MTGVLTQIWMPAAIGALILGTLLGVLRWKFGNSIIVIIMVWVALLVEFMATVAYTMGRVGFHLSTMAVGFVLGTTAIVGTVTMIYRQVVAPTRELTTLSQRIALGDLDGEVPATSRTEIGELAAAFKEMMDYLHAVADNANRVAQGDLSLHIEPRSERDTLGHAFIRMADYLEEMASAARNLAAGNLNIQIAPRSEGDVLGQAFLEMLQSWREITSNVSSVSTQLASSSEELSTMTEEVNTSASQVTETVQHVAEGAAHQAQQAERIQQSIHILANATQRIVHNTRETEAAVEAALHAVNTLRQQMDSLHQRSEGISSITTTVKRFADQTNLLALNAAIEAARAGEHGKSFAVVADEVRRLAENSRQAVSQIASLNNQIQDDVQLVLNSTSHLRDLVHRTAELARLSAQAAEEQQRENDHVKQAIEDMASISEEQAASAEEMAAAVEEQMTATEELATAAQELAQMAATLQHLVEKFKL